MSKSNDIIRKLVDRDVIRVDAETGDVFIARKNKLRRLKPYKDRYGYYRVTLSDPDTGHRTGIKIHRVVAYVLFGSIVFNPDYVVDHIDHNRTNNSATNLTIIPIRENNEKKVSNFLLPYKIILNGELIAVVRDARNAQKIAELLSAEVA